MVGKHVCLTAEAAEPFVGRDANTIMQIFDARLCGYGSGAYEYRAAAITPEGLDYSTTITLSADDFRVVGE